MSPLLTKSGTPKLSKSPKLSEVARKVCAPDGIVSTGWPAVEETCRSKLGIAFDPWQNQSGRLALSKRHDGKLAAMIDGVGMSICRQAGKTHWMTGLTFGLSVNQPLLTVWSAHHARTHGETFLAMQAFAERHRVAPYIDQVFVGSGDEEIRFRNGSRILFGARERGFGRGIPGVDIIVADEAQIMTERAVDAMTATMNTSRFGLAFYIGTPPRPEDPSDAFTRMRDEAWAGTLRDGVWIEFGADPDADPDSPTTWKVANPSYPKRTPRESMLRLKRKLSPDSFLREGLGIWPTSTGGVIGATQWSDLRDPHSLPTDPVSFGVYTNLSRTKSAIGVAARREDGKFHVEIVPAVRDTEVEWLPGTAWIPHRVKELAHAWTPCATVIDGHSAAASLIPEIEAPELDAAGEIVLPGVPVTVSNGPDMARACGVLYDAVTEGDLRHRGMPALAQAVASAKKRDLGDAWAWDRKDKGSDITQLVAVTLALHGLVVHGKPKTTEVWGFFE